MSATFRAMKLGSLSLAVCGMLSLAATRAEATLLFDESFDIDVPDTATFQATYPQFTTTTNGEVFVSGGILRMTGTGSDTNVPGYTQDILISGYVGGDTDSTSYNVGIRIGGARVIFHPTLSGGGFFRVDSGVIPNTDMGFGPGANTLHLMEIRQRPDGEFNVTVTNTNNPSETFQATFNTPANVGGVIGFTRSGSSTGAVPTFEGLFDDLTIRFSAQLTSNIGDGGTINFGVVPSGETATLTDVIMLQNTGLADSTISVTGFTITGPDGAQFDLPNFAPVTLTAGGSDTVLYDASFLAPSAVGSYSGLLTIMTDIGDITFNLQAQVVPEPSMLGLVGLGMIGVAARRRRRR